MIYQTQRTVGSCVALKSVNKLISNREKSPGNMQIAEFPSERAGFHVPPLRCDCDRCRGGSYVPRKQWLSLWSRSWPGARGLPRAHLLAPSALPEWMHPLGAGSWARGTYSMEQLLRVTAVGRPSVAALREAAGTSHHRAWELRIRRGQCSNSVSSLTSVSHLPRGRGREKTGGDANSSSPGLCLCCQ